MDRKEAKNIIKEIMASEREIYALKGFCLCLWDLINNIISRDSMSLEDACEFVGIETEEYYQAKDYLDRLSDLDLRLCEKENNGE